MDGKIAAPAFGARACGVLLIVVIVAYIFADYAIGEALSYVSQSGQWHFLNNASELKIRAIKRILSGLSTPVLLVAVTLLVLREYFPQESPRLIFNRFGFEKRPTRKIILLSFAAGIVFVLFFTKVLMNFFPPGDLVNPNPAAIVSNSPFMAQLIFAINLVTLVPVAEEFLFRGVLYEGLSLSWNKFFAAVVVTFIFILVHPDALRSGYWVSHLALYTIPILILAAREFTGSLYSPILIHSGFNFGSVFLS